MGLFGRRRQSAGGTGLLRASRWSRARVAALHDRGGCEDEPYYGLWWGGMGYAEPLADDMEEFASIREVAEALEGRAADRGDGRTLHRFAYVCRRTVNLPLPVALGPDSEITLYGDPASEWPYARVFIGDDGFA